MDAPTSRNNARLFYPALLFILTLLYFAAGKIGLSLAFVHNHVSAVWPPTGLSLAALLLFGYRVWPAVFLGAFLVNITTPTQVDGAWTTAIGSSLLIAFGNTLEAVCGAALARRFARGAAAFERSSDIFRFVLYAAVPSTLISALLGVTALVLFHQVDWHAALPVWITWWTGDFTSDLVVAPLLLTWLARRPPTLTRARLLEGAALVVLVFVVTQLRFTDILGERLQKYPVGIFTIPLFIWGAYRFHQRGAMLVAAMVSAAAIAGTKAGMGPFVHADMNESLIAVQSYIAVFTLTSLVLAALVSRQADIESALRGQEEHLRIALEGGQMGTWQWDVASGKVSCSPTLEELRGLAPGEFGGTFHAFMANIHPDDRERVRGAMTQAFEQGRAHHAEYRLLLKDGRIRWVEARGRLLCDAQGKPSGIVGVCMDVSQRQQSQQEREDLLQRERAARAEAERASRAKDQFLAVLSHELRTPLTPVMLSASMLESDERIPEHARRDLSTIRRNIELEARLIDDLLDLTRVARAKLRLDLQTTDLHSVIRHAIEICRGDAKASIEVQLQAQNHHVRADPARIQQVFWNLLSNAVKFTPIGGRISVRSRDGPEGQIIAQISDTGAGIEPELLPKLFNAFEQGEAVKDRKIGGLGLGLAISKALATAHGGTLTAHSEGKGRGSTFTLELPTVPPTPRQRAAVEQAASKPNRSLRILLVEDHESTLMVMTKLLSAWRHQVTTASSVAAAMKAAEHQNFDLVISDLGLPDGMGYDIMRGVRAHSGTVGIAISGYGMDDDIEKSKAAGFVEHLIKPVDPSALEAAIARAAVSIA